MMKPQVCLRDFIPRPETNKMTGLVKLTCLLLVFCAATLSSSAQTFTSLATFDGANGSYPFAPLVQATNGNFYGTTKYGGAFGNGTVFTVSPNGVARKLYNFCTQVNCGDGYWPVNGLVEAPNHDLYGMTPGGSTNNSGTLFKITPGGEFTEFYRFCSQTSCTDGLGPSALLVAANGNLYGTTYDGGANCTLYLGCGTFFEITPAGQLTTLYNFCSQTNSQGYCTDGLYPVSLLQGTDGNFYGTTQMGGGNCCSGVIFKITPAGKFTILYNFSGGSATSLTQGANGNLYGTIAPNGFPGEIFEVSLAGKFTILHDFCSKKNCADGSHPSPTLIQASDGNFYGTTVFGGSNTCVLQGSAVGCGTIFKITPRGKLTTLYSFCSQAMCTDGSSPEAGLIQGTDGLLYGTTKSGGDPACTLASGCGEAFSFDVGLPPPAKQ